MEYDIKELLEIFKDHANKIEEEGCGFNLPLALVCVIEEIQLIKRFITGEERGKR